MRRQGDTSQYAKGRYDQGRFEVIIKAPTLGLMTRIPGDQPDPRYATKASNVRFDDGVVRSAPGCSPILTPAPLDTPATLIFNCNVTPANGVDKLTACLVGSASKLYAVVGMVETGFPLSREQAIQFRGEINSYGQVRELATFNTFPPWTLLISVNDDLELWKLRTRNPGENDDGVSLLLPNDWGPTTNNVIFVRTR